MRLAPTIAVLHGCNLNMLGQRDPRHYGSLTLVELEREVEAAALALGWQCHFFQTNHEGELVEKIQELRRSVAGMLINPGAWTHYSYAIHDALELVEAPIVEVHLSAVDQRPEAWRHHSVIRDVCSHTISGRGTEGYKQALAWLATKIDSGK